MQFRLALPVAAILAATTACSQRVTPEEEYAEGDRGRSVLPAERTPAALGGAGRERPGRVMGGTTPETGAESASEEDVRGSVALAEGRGAGSGVLYLIVRRVDGAGGPPLAVQRHPVSAMPLEFAIGPEDAMIAGTRFPPRVRVVARLDRDGDPGTKSPGDLEATSDPVEPGASGVDLVLGGS